MTQPTNAFLNRGKEVAINCQVYLPDFEGPLDLLLHLIKNHELDLLNLPIAKITKQYLNYLNYMRELNLDLASEYLVMAATLIYLKSQIILPQEGLDEATGQDPKSQLIKKLIELKCYKEISRHLLTRPRLNREVFLAKNTGASEIEEGLEAEVALSNPFQLAKAFVEAQERAKTLVHHVVTDQIPISSCVEKIVETLKINQKISFQNLLPQLCTPQHVISMFLGCLEMARMQMSVLDQDEIFGPLHISRAVEVDDLERANRLMKGLSWE